MIARAHDRLTILSDRKLRALGVATERRRARFEAVGDRFRRTPYRLSERIDLCRERLEALAARAERCHRQRLAAERSRLEAAGKLLQSLSYKSVLQRGFALVRDEEGRPLRSAAGVAPGSGLSVEFGDETRLEAIVAPGAATTDPNAKPRRRKSSSPRQGDLF